MNTYIKNHRILTIIFLSIAACSTHRAMSMNPKIDDSQWLMHIARVYHQKITEQAHANNGDLGEAIKQIPLSSEAYDLIHRGFSLLLAHNKKQIDQTASHTKHEQKQQPTLESHATPPKPINTVSTPALDNDPASDSDPVLSFLLPESTSSEQILTSDTSQEINFQLSFENNQE